MIIRLFHVYSNWNVWSIKSQPQSCSCIKNSNDTVLLFEQIKAFVSSSVSVPHSMFVSYRYCFDFHDPHTHLLCLFEDYSFGVLVASNCCFGPPVFNIYIHQMNSLYLISPFDLNCP